MWRRVDLIAGEWLPPFHTNLVCVAVHGRVFVTGKATAKKNGFAYYDVQKATWENIPVTDRSPQPRDKAAVAAFDDLVYLYGGESPPQVEDSQKKRKDGALQRPRFFPALDDFYQLNMKTLKWKLVEQNGEIPTARRYATLTAVPSLATERRSGALLLHGGSGTGIDGEMEFNDTWVYDIDSKTWERWETLGPTPPPRERHAAVYVGNHVIIQGGTAKGVILSDAWRLNLSTREWEEIEPHGPLPGPRIGHSFVCDPWNRERVMLFGGLRSVDMTLGDAIVVYNSRSCTWKILNTEQNGTKNSGPLTPGARAGQGFVSLYPSAAQVVAVQDDTVCRITPSRDGFKETLSLPKPIRDYTDVNPRLFEVAKVPQDWRQYPLPDEIHYEEWEGQNRGLGYKTMYGSMPLGFYGQEKEGVESLSSGRLAVLQSLRARGLLDGRPEWPRGARPWGWGIAEACELEDYWLEQIQAGFGGPTATGLGLSDSKALIKLKKLNHNEEADAWKQGVGEVLGLRMKLQRQEEPGAAAAIEAKKKAIVGGSSFGVVDEDGDSEGEGASQANRSVKPRSDGKEKGIPILPKALMEWCANTAVTPPSRGCSCPRRYHSAIHSAHDEDEHNHGNKLKSTATAVKNLLAMGMPEVNGTTRSLPSIDPTPTEKENIALERATRHLLVFGGVNVSKKDIPSSPYTAAVAAGGFFTLSAVYYLNLPPPRRFLGDEPRTPRMHVDLMDMTPPPSPPTSPTHPGRIGTTTSVSSYLRSHMPASPSKARSGMATPFSQALEPDTDAGLGYQSPDLAKSESLIWKSPSMVIAEVKDRLRLQSHAASLPPHAPFSPIATHHRSGSRIETAPSRSDAIRNAVDADAMMLATASLDMAREMLVSSGGTHGAKSRNVPHLNAKHEDTPTTVARNFIINPGLNSDLERWKWRRLQVQMSRVLGVEEPHEGDRFSRAAEREVKSKQQHRRVRSDALPLRGAAGTVSSPAVGFGYKGRSPSPTRISLPSLHQVKQEYLSSRVPLNARAKARIRTDVNGWGQPRELTQSLLKGSARWTKRNMEQ